MANKGSSKYCVHYLDDSHGCVRWERSLDGLTPSLVISPLYVRPLDYSGLCCTCRWAALRHQQKLSSRSLRPRLVPLCQPPKTLRSRGPFCGRYIYFFLIFQHTISIDLLFGHNFGHIEIKKVVFLRTT